MSIMGKKGQKNEEKQLVQTDILCDELHAHTDAALSGQLQCLRRG